MEPDMAVPVNRRGSVLPKLVDGLRRITPIIYNNECSGIRLPVACRGMDEPSPQNNMMNDRFNEENESFMQETERKDNEYSVNLPTRFYYKKKWNKGWINVVNPFRATIVLGTPGSGKSFAVVNNFIKQQIEKGFGIYLYDYKYV